jgi:hypothetical protein
MKVEQISIFLENKAGRLAEVAGVLGDADINIRALALADTTDFGILRLIVNDHEKAKQVLKENGFTVGRTEVVAVEVDDRPGGLNRILRILFEAGINVIFRFDDIDNAVDVLMRHGVTVIEGQKLYAM